MGTVVRSFPFLIVLLVSGSNLKLIYIGFAVHLCGVVGQTLEGGQINVKNKQRRQQQQQQQQQQREKGIKIN